ncbi:MAG: hypothetical protein ABFC42_10260 [Sulfuricella sp.]
MTRDEIISMARAAGITWSAEDVPEIHDYLVQFAEMVASAERDEIATALMPPDRQPENDVQKMTDYIAHALAAAIRERLS